MMTAANLIGPPLGALLFTLSPGSPFLVDAISFAVAAMLVWQLARQPFARGRTPAPQAETGSWEMLRAGVVYLGRHSTLRTLAIAVGVINAITGGVIAVLVLYVTQALTLPEQGYGWMVATFAVGGVIGSFLATAVIRLCGARVCTIGTLLAFSLVVIALGASTTLGVVVPALAFGGAVSVVWNVVTISYRQRTVPVELLGRVTSAYRMISFLGMPAGAVVAGLLTHAVGVSRTYLIGGFTLLFAGLLIAPFLRRLPPRGTATSPKNEPIPKE